MHNCQVLEIPVTNYDNNQSSCLYSSLPNSSLCLHASHVARGDLSLCDKYYDNACSHSMVPSLDCLNSAKSLLKSFSIGGIGGSSLLATHVGVLPGFPPHLGLAYWGPNFDVFLVSLGHIQRCGGYYVGKGDFLTIHNIDGTILDHVPLLSNNLCPVHIGDPSSSLAFVSRRYTAEEIARMNVAEDLHIFYDHPSDEVLIEGINYGHVPTHITATAVVNNRALRGPCPHCIVGKITNDPMPVSLLTEPESRVPQTLSQDVHQLHVSTSSGRTHKSNIVDHKSGHFGVITHISKKATDITMDVKKYIATQYNG